MGRAAWRTSLLPPLLPLLSLVAAVALASRWSVLDPIQASIVERWLPLAALLVAAVAVGSSLPRWNLAAPFAALAALPAVALVAPGESHIRLGWLYLGFVVPTSRRLR